MIKTIKNKKKNNIQFLINTNLRDIIVLVREKIGMELFDKLKVKYMIVDEYPIIDAIDNLSDAIIVKEQEINGEIVILLTIEDYSLEYILEHAYTKFKENREIEEYINSSFKNMKTIDFPDEEEDEIDKIMNDDIVDLRI